MIRENVSKDGKSKLTSEAEQLRNLHGYQKEYKIKKNIKIEKAVGPHGNTMKALKCLARITVDILIKLCNKILVMRRYQIKCQS